MSLNGEPVPVEIPAEAIVGHLIQRLAQLSAELELARATIAYLTTASDTMPAPTVTEPLHQRVPKT